MYQNPDNGYWYDDEGNRISADALEALQPADSYVTLPGGPTYFGETVNGQQYAYLSQFANNGATPEQSTQIELDYLAGFGIKPIWDAVKGWLVPVNAAYAAAHPIQQESGFDKFLGIVMPAAIQAGMLAGFGAGFSELLSGATSAADTGVNAGGLDGPLGDSAANYSAGMGDSNILTGAVTADMPGLDLAAQSVDTGVNAGGLDGPLGDSAANYSAGMGDSNILTPSLPFDIPLLDSVPSAIKTAAGGLATTAGKALAAVGVGKIASALTPRSSAGAAGGYRVGQPRPGWQSNALIAAFVMGTLGLVLAVHKK